MPREIADSDDELELLPPPPVVKQTHHKAPPSSTAERELDPFSAINFDQFLSPTQRISSYDRHYDDPLSQKTESPKVDSSTEKFLKEVASVVASNESAPEVLQAGVETPASGKSIDKAGTTQDQPAHLPDMPYLMEDAKSATVAGNSSAKKTGKKRSRANERIGDATTSLVASKKSRTQGPDQSTRTNMSEGLFEVTDVSDPNPADHENTIDLINLVSLEPGTEYITTPASDNFGFAQTDVAGIVNPNLLHHENGYHSYRPYSPAITTSFTGLNSGTLSSGDGQSLQFDKSQIANLETFNPFGSISNPGTQDEQIECDDRIGSISSLFGKNAESGGGTKRDSGGHVRYGAESMELIDSNRIQDQNGSRESVEDSMISAVHDATEEVPVEARSRKRVRKGKTDRRVDVQVDNASIDELQDELYANRAIRASTVESVSAVSVTSQSTARSKSKTPSGRKSKKAKRFDIIEVPKLEPRAKKLPSSDLGLDNKAVIGLSPERYKPRPSKRRGRADPVVAPELDPVEEVASFLREEELRNSAQASRQATPTLVDEKVIEQEEAAITTRKKRSKTRPKKESPMEETQPEASALDDTEQHDKPMEPDIAVTMDDEDIKNPVPIKSRQNPRVLIDISSLRPDEPRTLAPEPKRRGRKRKQSVLGDLAEAAKEAVRAESDKSSQASPQKETKQPSVEPLSDAEEPEPEKKRSALAEKDMNTSAKPRGRGRPKKSVAKIVEESTEAEDDQENKSATQTTEIKPEAEEEIKSVATAAVTPTPAGPESKTPKPPTNLKEEPSSTPSVSWQTKTRVGLTKKYKIPSLLSKIDRNKEGPKAIIRKEKLTKAQELLKEQERIAREEAEAEGREWKPMDELRDRDGRLVEWDF